MPNNLSELDRILLNRLVGLVTLLFIVTCFSFAFLTESLFLIQVSFLGVSTILLGVVVSASIIYTKIKKSFFWFLLIIIMLLLLSLKIGLLFLVMLITLTIIIRAYPYIQSSTMLIVAGVLVTLASLLISYNYLQYKNWNIIINSVIHYQTFFSSDLIILLAFAFCFLASNLLGFWLVKNNWLSNYHFSYNTLSFYAKVGFFVTIAWLFLHWVGFYSLFANNKLWIIILILDTLTIQFLLSYLVLFLTIRNENFKLGIKINHLLEWLGAKWKVFIPVLLLAIVLIEKYLKLI